MRFKPYIGLTIVTAICLAILLSLGTWQMQRLAWKTQLLIDLETASTAAPFESINEIVHAVKTKQPIDFRRVSLSARYLPIGSSAVDGVGSEEFHVLRVENKTTGWRLYRPIIQNEHVVFAAGEWISDSAKQEKRTSAAREHIFSGYVRSYEKPSRFAAKSSPELNRWMSFNPDPDEHNWADRLKGYEVQTGFYIDVHNSGAAPMKAESEGDLAPLMPEVPNNHFDYMLTWYGFALTLFVIYILLHIKGNRLTFGRLDKQ